jgi:hypothetical protein
MPASPALGAEGTTWAGNAAGAVRLAGDGPGALDHPPGSAHPLGPFPEVRMLAGANVVDVDLANRLDGLERARQRLQDLDFARLSDPAMAYRVTEVLGLWDRLRSTISDVLATLPGGEE